MKQLDKTIVIILNWNGLKDTEECLESIFEYYKTSVPKVLVVDNGSIKNEAKILEKKYGDKAAYLRLDRNYGYCGGNNAGFKFALRNKYKYVIILNNDTVISLRLFERLLKPFSDQKVGAVGATIVDYGNKKIIQNRGFEYSPLIGTSFAIDQGATIDQNPKVVNNPFVSGACFCLKIATLKGEDLFDADFFCYFEEIDLCLRLKNNGYLTKVVADAYVYHKGEASSAKITGFTEFQLARNRLWLIKKSNSTLFKCLSLLINLLLYFPYRILVLLFRHQGSNIKYFIRGFRIGLLNKANHVPKNCLC